MADPIKGFDVILQVYKAGQFRDYLCATDVTIELKTDLQSVKTIGDGYWQRYRTQSIGYVISLNGLININNVDDPTSFDLLDYEMNMVEFQYKITFRNENNDIRAINGYGTIESSKFNGNVDGFGKAEFVIYGNGPFTITNS